MAVEAAQLRHVRDQRRGDDGADAGNGHENFTSPGQGGIVLNMAFDLFGNAFDVSVERFDQSPQFSLEKRRVERR